MLDDLDALAAKLHELAGRIGLLREENQQLRSQLAAATGELESTQRRVAEAMQRIDALLEQLPDESAAGSRT